MTDTAPKSGTSRGRRAAWSAVALAAVVTLGLTALLIGRSAGTSSASSASPAARSGHAAAAATQSAGGTARLAGSGPSPAATNASPTAFPLPSSTVPAPAAAAVGQAQQVQLAASQLPAASVQKWTPVGTLHTRDIAGLTMHEDECVSVWGASLLAQQGFSGVGGENMVGQDTYIFATPGAAQAAYQQVVTGLTGCQSTSRALQTSNNMTPGAVVTKTAATSDAQAWERSWTAVSGMSTYGAQTNHLYVALGGDRLIVLQFTEFPGQAAAYDTAGDPPILAALGSELAE